MFYIALTLLAVNLYGERIKINLFEHLENDDGYLSLGVRLLFLVIFFFKIPFIFFPGKLSIFNMIAEYRTGNISESIQLSCSLKSTVTFGIGDDFSRSVNTDFASFPGEIDPMADCDEKTYYTVCFIYIMGVSLGACVCNDLSAIFGVIAACYGTLMDYIFPGLFFLSGMTYLE